MTTAKRYDSVWDAIEEHPVEAENLKVRAALMAELSAYIDGLIDDGSRRKPGGVLDTLVATSEEGDRLTRQEVITTCGLLLMAGHETTANLIANGVLALLGQPDELAALRAGDVPIDLAVDELLRHDGPVQMVQRVVLEALSRHPGERDDVRIGVP